MSGSPAVLTEAALSGSALTVVNAALVTDGGTVALTGLLTLVAGPGATPNTLSALLGSSIEAAGAVLADGSVTIDSTSPVEIGLASTAVAGMLTADPGASLAGTVTVSAITDIALITAGRRRMALVSRSAMSVNLGNCKPAPGRRWTC